MPSFETWFEQDALQLTVEDWISILQNKEIFDKNAKEMVLYVYDQPGKYSTASDIGNALNRKPQQAITALNRKLSIKIYSLWDKDAPPNSEGGKRYWNVLFDGRPDNPLDKNGHFIWKLRSNLISALETVLKNNPAWIKVEN